MKTTLSCQIHCDCPTPANLFHHESCHILLIPTASAGTRNNHRRSLHPSLLQVQYDNINLTQHPFSIVFSYKDYGYREVAAPGVPNYVFAFVSMPVKIACAIIPFIIYGGVGITNLVPKIYFLIGPSPLTDSRLRSR